jgi:hypothetical protein
VEKDQRKCFLCDKPGHVARDCKERKAPIKAVRAYSCWRTSRSSFPRVCADRRRRWLHTSTAWAAPAGA